MSSTLLFFLLTCWLCANQASALRCMQCSSEHEEANENCTTAENVTGTYCDEQFHDLCFKIVTIRLNPNNGPQDRLQDNGEIQIVSRGCGSKEDFERFAEVDSGCSRDSLGGGGTQERCICSGNDCNAAASIQAGLALLATVLLFRHL